MRYEKFSFPEMKSTHASYSSITDHQHSNRLAKEEKGKKLSTKRLEGIKTQHSTPVCNRNLPAQVSMQDYKFSPNQVIQDFICQQLLK